MNQPANPERKQSQSPLARTAFLVLLGLAVGLGVACGGQTQADGKGKILYYRNPMDPKITSPTPMKDGMGMDYIPVYEKEGKQP